MSHVDELRRPSAGRSEVTLGCPELPAGRSVMRAAARRTACTVLGVGLLVAGAVMVVLPGPGLLVAVAGLAVMAREYHWAARLLARCRERTIAATTVLTASRGARRATALSATTMVVAGVGLAWWAEGYRVLGATLAASGVCAVATLVPPIRRRLGLDPPAAAPAAAVTAGRAGGTSR